MFEINKINEIYVMIIYTFRCNYTIMILVGYITNFITELFPKYFVISLSKVNT